MRVLSAILWAVAMLCVRPAAAGDFPSRGPVAGQPQTPEARAYWQQAMEGKKAPDGLGARLPPSLSAKSVAALILPPGEPAAPKLVGAAPWPAVKDGYVAIVCTGGGRSEANAPRCERSYDRDMAPPLHVYVGVIAAPPGAAPRLLARSGRIDGAVDWRLSDLPAPQAAIESDDRPVRPQAFARFDLSPYRIAPGQPAFGLRATWTDPYTGGLAGYAALYLFALDGGSLKQVLAVPIAAFEDIVDRWLPNAVHRRFTDIGKVLVVSSEMTEGHFDLIVRGTDFDRAKARPRGDFAGVGIDLSLENGLLRVRSPIPGGPAAKAGLQPGDRITRLDGRPAQGMTEAQVIARLRGPPGGTVALRIRRPGRPAFGVTLTRATIGNGFKGRRVFKWSAAAGAYRAAECVSPCG